MKHLPSSIFLLLGCVFFTTVSNAQVQQASLKTTVKPVMEEEGLFKSDEVMTIRLSGDLRPLLNDRGEIQKYHPITLYYTSKDSGEVSLSIKAKTRGKFRRDRQLGNCSYPPLLLNFPKQKPGSVFASQNKLKLVTPCVSDDYVVREYLVYKIYNLVTDASFRARLVKVDLDDTKKNKQTKGLYGILLEEDEQMAKRNRSVLLKKKMVRMDKIERSSFLKMAVFEYLIGNTDWSVPYLHNTRLIGNDSISIPSVVPYDFDHAGIVNAPYANPDEALQLSSVRERRYRGFCVSDMKAFDETIALYNKLKKDIYDLYSTSSLLDAKYVKSTIKWLDEFYETINSPKLLKDEFGYPCRQGGTGNVVIKGLNSGD